MKAFTKSSVRSYMNSVVEDHRDPLTGEVNSTALAEDAAAAFDQNHLEGPLDDETHWVWELALAAG
jgi:hypothetical protein